MKCQEHKQCIGSGLSKYAIFLQIGNLPPLFDMSNHACKNFERMPHTRTACFVPWPPWPSPCPDMHQYFFTCGSENCVSAFACTLHITICQPKKLFHTCNARYGTIQLLLLEIQKPKISEKCIQIHIDLYSGSVAHCYSAVQ